MSIDRMSMPGLSGYDFTGIVQSMVQVYSLPKVKMIEQQSDLQIRQNAWRDIKTRLSALENTLSNLRSESTWTATKATSSKPDLLSVSSTSAAVNGVYNVKIINFAQAQTVVSTVQNVQEATSATSVTAGSFSIQVGDTTKTIDVAAGASLKEIADSINNAKAGVTASVIQVAEGSFRLAVVANKTGVANKATFAELNGGTVLHDLGILDSADVLNQSQVAEDAELEINGITNIKSATNIVTNAIPGLTLTLNGEDPNTTVTVKISSDYSVAQKAVQSFIDQYNSAQDFIANKLSYDKETKKTGDLFGDPVLQNLQERLRRIVTNTVNNPTEPYKTLSDVGITTSSSNHGIEGKLEFDTSKFNEAMESNPQSVANLFGAPAAGVTPRTEKTAEGSAQGLANIMEEYLEPMVKFDGSLDKMGKTIGDQITDVKKRIEDFNNRIAAYEERLTLKFARLESTLAQLSSESNWLGMQVNTMMAQTSSNKK